MGDETNFIDFAIWWLFPIVTVILFIFRIASSRAAEKIKECKLHKWERKGHILICSICKKQPNINSSKDD